MASRAVVASLPDAVCINSPRSKTKLVLAASFKSSNSIKIFVHSWIAGCIHGRLTLQSKFHVSQCRTSLISWVKRREIRI
eukprot:2599255-Rhodomonas_salina.1